MSQQPITAVLGSGAIAVAIARRVSTGKHILLVDLRLENAEKAAQTLREAGFACSTIEMDVSTAANRCRKSPTTPRVSARCNM